MNKDAFSTIDSSELTHVCGGSFSFDLPGSSGDGGGARDQDLPPSSTKRSVKIGYKGIGFEGQREDTNTDYSLCLRKHPKDTKEQCGLPPA
ncbi:MAG TPA: hypothetical protein VFV99_01340 [Kofleriaceae bacterium]|nr:hypothetical protein [Kofleriaceae bacterium]